MALPAPQRQSPVLTMSACPFAWDWMAAVTGPAGTRGCSLPEGLTFHDTAIATKSAVTWPPGTSIGRVRIAKSILRERDPCALSDLIAETVRRNPEITAFHVRPSGADYSSLLESLSTRLPSDHARMGDADIVVRTTGNGIVIESNNHEVRDADEHHVSEEVIQVLQTAHQMSLSTRNMLKLERNCTPRELMEGRSKLLQYVATALEVSSGWYRADLPLYVHSLK